MHPGGSSDWTKLVKALRGEANTAYAAPAAWIPSAIEDTNQVILTGIVRYASANLPGAAHRLALIVDDILVSAQTAARYPNLQPGNRLTIMGDLCVIEGCECNGSDRHRHLIVEGRKLHWLPVEPDKNHLEPA